MRLGSVEASLPTLLAIGFALVVAVVLLVAASTSATAFGPHNPGWQGLSEVRDVADEAGLETTVVTDPAEYDAVSPEGTVVLLVAPSETTAADRARLRTFVEAGGTVVVATSDPAAGNSLLSALDTELRVDGASLRDEREHDPTPDFPVVTGTAENPSVSGVEGMALNHGTALTVAGAGPEPLDDDVAARGEHVSIWAGHVAWADGGPVPLANSSAFSYADRNGNDVLDSHELLAERAVVASESVGDGEVVAVSDPSAFINVMLERDANRALVAGLLGEHDRVVLDRTDDGVPPLVALLVVVRDTPALGALAGLALVGGVLAWERRPLRGRWPALRRGASIDETELRPDREAMAAYVRRRYPDLDDRQRERVLAGIMGVGRERGEHDRAD